MLDLLPDVSAAFNAAVLDLLSNDTVCFYMPWMPFLDVSTHLLFLTSLLVNDATCRLYSPGVVKLFLPRFIGIS
ncbi:hypothetical protein TNCV_4713931 [Trichonephila clavipes]|nr:hypothetical protein TNCV_4713931 [Trichonephila clavipes]